MPPSTEPSILAKMATTRSCGVGIRRAVPHFGLRLGLAPLTRTIYGSTAVTFFLLARHLRSGFASNTRFTPFSSGALSARPRDDGALSVQVPQRIPGIGDASDV